MYYLLTKTENLKISYLGITKERKNAERILRGIALKTKKDIKGTYVIMSQAGKMIILIENDYSRKIYFKYEKIKYLK
jgi:hypothetical protein